MKPKQLIWRNGRAVTPFGVYQVVKSTTRKAWWFGFRTEWQGDFRTKKAAQAAAQADFERRVRECLEVDQ